MIAAQAFEYSAFGDLLSTSTPETRYLYTGQQYDSATDLYSLRARYYDAGVGRFMSRDTWAYDFESPVELNRYVYAMGNPVRWADPSGYSIVETVQTYLNPTRLFVWAKAARHGYLLGARVYRIYSLIVTFAPEGTLVSTHLLTSLTDRGFYDVMYFARKKKPSGKKADEIEEMEDEYDGNTLSDNNQAQNKEYKDAARQAEQEINDEIKDIRNASGEEYDSNHEIQLRDEDWTSVHQQISKRGLNKREIIEIMKERLRETRQYRRLVGGE